MCSIPRGQGAVVALNAMIDAFGTLSLNLYFGGVAVLKRKCALKVPIVRVGLVQVLGGSYCC